MLAGMYAGEGKNGWPGTAQTSEMVFTQPVIHEFPRISTPTLLLIGGPTAPRLRQPGAGRGRQTPGQLPRTGPTGRRHDSPGRLVAFPDLGIHPKSRRRKNFTVP